MATISSLFHLDNLALVMSALIMFIGIGVATFSWRYMKGDRAYGIFYLRLAMIIISTLIMVSANNILLFLCSWAISNIVLVLLMIHKSSWDAARKSGFLAFKNFMYGFISLTAAFAVLYIETGETSIEAIVTHPFQLIPTVTVAILILATAMTQSAIWPVHRWLISSLNSPTPVSAMMHAGLINGGGFLLVRFKDFYLNLPESLNIIFIIGLITAFVGTLWKLLQSDVKRMLACSTMSQMGFMIMQCGLGLFSTAIAHLVWHGLFKSYFFLASGSAAQEKRQPIKGRPSIPVFMVSLICGFIGAYLFSYFSRVPVTENNTTLFLVGMSLIASTQMTLVILNQPLLSRLLAGLIIVALANILYGLSVQGFKNLLPGLMLAQPLNMLYILGFCGLTLAWLVMIFRTPAKAQKNVSKWKLRFYVWALNASQPYSKTITTHRNNYQY